MTWAAAEVSFGSRGPMLRAKGTLPFAALVLGRPVGEVLETLPRVFNLCRVAQTNATRLALGLQPDADAANEVIRDHVLKLCVLLPRAFGWPQIAVPRDPVQLLGRNGLPVSIDGLATWQSPVAEHAWTIASLFGPGEAACNALPAPPEPLAEGAFENSAAGRQAGHPLLQVVEENLGRGPLWRYCGLLADLEAALSGLLPEPTLENGIAHVAAARGGYGLRLQQAAGLVTGMTRRTPTDHLLAPGGAFLQSLARLPARRRPLAGAVVALLDPCIPVTIVEAAHA